MVNTASFLKGINQDVHPKHQPESTYRWALNTVLETEAGDITTISNEIGNTYCASNWPNNKVLIGHSLTDTKDVVVFFFDPTDTRPYHEIGVYNTDDCTYRTLVKGQFLNFSVDHPVNALFRIRNGCDRYVYFTDNYNVYRVINISDTSDWVDPSTLSLIDPAKIQLTRNFTPPTVENLFNPATKTILDGAGNLEYGSYAFYFRYLDTNFNPTFEWLPLTHYIKIGHGLQSNENTDLLYGASNVSDSPFYQPKSNKAIRLDFSNIDQTFTYFQIAVVKRTSDSGTISSVDVLFPQPISTGFDGSFIYTGAFDQVLNQISLDELLVPSQPIDVITSHTIDDRRLFLAGNKVANKESDPDSLYHSLYPTKRYYSYQKFASKIKVTYKATAIEQQEAKTGNNNLYGETLNPDEIKALAIVYLHSDGRKSPAFHIPGRPADIDMTNQWSPVIPTYTNWDTDDITGDVNIFNTSKTKRWQVYSTATIDTTTSTTSEAYGYLGYYETPTTYPNMPICDEEDEQLYWGEDWDGNPIIPGVTKIRHHRLPAEWLYKDTARDNAYSFYPQYKYNLIVEGVEPPDSSVIGYYIVVADDLDNKTVLDRGYLRAMNYDPTDQVYYNAYTTWNSLINNLDNTKWNYYAFISPNTVYDSVHKGGDYISIQKRLETSTTNNSILNPAGGISVNVNEFDISINVDTRIHEYTKYRRPLRYNYKVNRSSLLRKSNLARTEVMPTTSNSIYLQSSTGERLENRSLCHDVAYMELDTYLADYADMNIVCGVTSCVGQNSITRPINFVAVTKADKDVYTNLFNLKYKLLYPNWYESNFTGQQIIYGGDYFIPNFNTLDIFYENSSPIAELASTSLVCDKNIEFREYSDLERGKFTWYRYLGGYQHSPLARHVAFKYFELIADQGQFWPEYYSVSDKYNYQLPELYYFPIQYDYDLCNDCIEDTPYRIYYSEQDNEEQKADLLRIIKANNYANSLGEYGPITDIFSHRNSVYLATENSIQHLPVRPQQLQSNEDSITIGTGEILSLPFSSLTTTAYALGGYPSFKHRVNHEFGATYIDPKSARVFLLSDGFNDLSLNGLRNFWKENGEVSFLKQFKQLTGQDFPYTQPLRDIGVGYTTTFDPRFNRLIISKKDYELLRTDLILDSNNTNPYSFWFDGNAFYMNDDEGISTKIDISNTQYVRDRSFTISYSFTTNSWVSFHSYFPTYMFNNHDTFYTNGPWKHNEGNYQTYYNIKYPHIVDTIIPQNILDGKLSTNVFYASTSEWFNPFTQTYQWDDQTYTGLIAYNSSQSSGYQPIIPKSNNFQSDVPGSIMVDYVDNKYRINDLRDLTEFNHNPIWSTSWDLLQATPYLDKVPNIFNIVPNKSFFEQRRFRDHYLGLRFYFEPAKNVKIATDLIATLHANRNR